MGGNAPAPSVRDLCFTRGTLDFSGGVSYSDGACTTPLGLAWCARVTDGGQWCPSAFETISARLCDCLSRFACLFVARREAAMTAFGALSAFGACVSVFGLVDAWGP